MNDLALRDEERRDLEQYEDTIREGLGTFMSVGTALLAIRNRRLYREQFTTFEDYCREKWAISRAHAYRMIDAASVVDRLSPIGDILPSNEAQVRPLAALPPEAQAAAWQEAVESAPDGKVTAAHVEEVARRHNPKLAEYEREYNRPEYEEDGNNGGRQKPKRSYPANDETAQGIDACQTPPYALDPLLPYLPRHWTIWEPAAGEGLLADGLYDAGVKTVIQTDIISGQNFFEFEPAVAWHCVVTNPPYSIKYKWLRHCYALSRPFALLLPVETLGAKQAQTLFRERGINVIFMDRRIAFKMPRVGFEGSNPQFPVAWFTWGLEIGAQMVFAELGDDE